MNTPDFLQIHLLTIGFTEINQFCNCKSIYNTEITINKLAFASAASDAEDFQISREEITQFVEEISSLTDKTSIRKMFECLKSMKPHVVGITKGNTINILNYHQQLFLLLEKNLIQLNVNQCNNN